MKRAKRGLAVLLAVLLMFPAQSMAAESAAGVPTETAAVSEQQEENLTEEGGTEESPAVEEGESGNDSDEESQKEDAGQESGTSEETSGSAETESSENATEGLTEEQGTTVPEEGSTETSGIETTEENGTEASEETESAEAEETTEETTEELTEGTTEETTETMTEETETEVKTVPDEEILVNTGKHAYSIVGREDFQKYELGDDCFEEDGSYTIKIPEKDPFFPYEVQFSYGDEVTEEWFMTPDDSVEINGHEFFVSAEFSGEVITQMNLNVAGESVVVYPEEKEFTDEEGITPLSLLPLKRDYLNVYLRGFSPIELARVKMESVFAGQREIKDTDKIVWKYQNDYKDGYEISSPGDEINLSYYTSEGGTTWEMIVGEADQLAGSNIRYEIRIYTTDSSEWLKPVVHVQDADGVRKQIDVGEACYDDRYYTEDSGFRRYNRRCGGRVSTEAIAGKEKFISLNIDNSLFSKTRISSVRIFKGVQSEEEVMPGEDITDQIIGQGIPVQDDRYYFDEDLFLTGLDSSGNVIASLPLELYIYNDTTSTFTGISHYWQAKDKEEWTSELFDTRHTENEKDGCTYVVRSLYKGISASTLCRVEFDYVENGTTDDTKVTAAYVGKYNTIAEAQAAGAVDIKDTLSYPGYEADYSQGIYFTFFIGKDGSEQKKYYMNCKVKEGNTEKPGTPLNSGTTAYFNGLYDRNGTWVSCYCVDREEDSYAEYNYLTILVGKDTDLTALAPVFSVADKGHLYAAGSNSPEVSGKSYHDFSQGPVQYTASAEDGKNAKNFWLHVVKTEEGTGQLYINSLSDGNAETKVENGTVYSSREIMMDSYHGNIHDILLVNKGTQAIDGILVELSSDTVELDKYWTLTGNHELSAFDKKNIREPNLAKIRLRAKKPDTSGNHAGKDTEISGTLTVKSGNSILMVLNLTGWLGDPEIITNDIPHAVKYVPYGAMLQNNNKYSWNKPEYRKVSGKLPKGMVLKSNGEIYGVPRETGEFEFTVEMENTSHEFPSSQKTFILTVLENTDANVDASTDQGYNLTQRIQDISLDATESQTVVSQGVYDEFVDVYLDGKKLTEGEDYTSESGSTRITIRSQTLKASNVTGTHTIGIEFRTEGTDILKRAAQNYEVGGGSGNQDGGNSGSGNNENSGNHDNDNDDSDDGGSGVLPEINAGTATPAQGAVIGQTDGMTTEQVGETALPDLEGVNNGIVAYYTVQRGDTLWKIAEKFYGTGMYWTQIYEDNKNVLSNPNRIYAGQELVIRVTTYISKGTDENGNATYYIVEKGDTLSEIAKKMYGKRRYWRKIYKANETISDPNRIYVGQRILIPEL